MASLKHIARKLRVKNAKSHVVFLAFVLAIVFSLAVFARYYAFEAIKLQDSTMHPHFKNGETLWMCKLPQCLEDVKIRDDVWVVMPNKESMIRKIIALPGTQISFSDDGLVKTEGLEFHWKNENAFIESRTIYIPKKGDTLQLDQLNDVEQDYAITILKAQGKKFYTKTTLWQGDNEISMDHVGTTKLENRQVSLQEVGFLPWQDRYLIELQVRQNEPGNVPYKLKREVFNAVDSTQISQVIVQEDCYFLACEKGYSCRDSREMGYIRKSLLKGLYMDRPTKIMNTGKRYAKIIFVETIWESLKPTALIIKELANEKIEQIQTLVKEISEE